MERKHQRANSVWSVERKLSSEKYKFSILFGAGADRDAVASLECGDTFMSNILTASSEQIVFQKDKFLKNKFLNWNSLNIYLQTICEHIDEAKKLFGEEAVNKYQAYYAGDEEVKKYKEEIYSDRNEWYKILTYNGEHHSKKYNEDDIKNFFLNNMSFYQSLDSMFNDLRYGAGGNFAKRVISAYVAIFNIIATKLYDFKQEKQSDIEIIKQLSIFSYKNKVEEECYYEILKNLFHESDGIGLITTNYTNVLRDVTGKKDDDIAYLHGKLTWFEEPYKLRIYDSENEEDMECIRNHIKDIFPFIMIASGVKPIISTKQIEQYSKMIRFLDESETLYVVGYKFNRDDNHINSIIVEWLNKDDNRKLIILDFNKTVELQEIATRLRNDFPNQIYFEPVDEHNARDKFENLMKKEIGK